MMMFFDSSASSGIDCKAWRSDWAADSNAASSRLASAWAMAAAAASSGVLPLLPSLESPSFSCGRRGQALQ